MGTFTRPLTIHSADGTLSETVDALIDTGSTFSVVPWPMLDRLGFQPTQDLPFTLADNRTVIRPAAEIPAEVEGRRTTTWCIFGDVDTESILGVYTLEGTRLMVDPVDHRLVPLPLRL